MLTKEEMPACPVATTVQLIGSKWKLLIMRNLLQRPWRFNELRKNLEGISQKVLTDSLRSMEECCFSKRMRKLFRKNEKSVLQFCNKSSKTKRAFTKVLMPCKRPF